MASVNILLQNTKQDGAAHKSIMRTGTETGVKMIQREGVTSGVQIHTLKLCVTTTSSNKLQPKIHMLPIILNITSLIDSYPRELDQ